MEITKARFEEVVSKILNTYSDQLLHDTKGQGACLTEDRLKSLTLGRVDTLLWLGLIDLDEWTALTCKVMDVHVFHMNYVNTGLKAAYATEEVTVIRRITPADISFRRPA